jgi:phage-related protein (TIGR01555 family)
MTDKKREERNRKRREAYAAKKAAENASQNIRHLDAFFSEQVGAGIAGVDKFASFQYGEDSKLDEALLERLYIQNDLAATIVDRKVKDALREGYLLDWQGASDPEIRDVIDWAESKYDVTKEVAQANIFGRLFGGGVVLMGIDGDPERPAMEGRDIEFIRAVPSRYLKSHRWYADPTEQNFGKPSSYRWTIRVFAPAEEGNTGIKSEPEPIQAVIHESRTIPFYGILTTDDRFRINRGWGDSVLQRVFEVLKKFETSFDSILHALSENSLGVYKVQGLLKMLASENASLLQARFRLLNLGKSNYNSIVMDENESFERVEARLSEAANVVQAAMLRVAGAANMPATLLFGMSPAGMNATGQSDLENWHQQVSQHQKLELAPALRKLYRWLLAQPDSPLNGQVPEDLKVEFPPLWTPSLQDQVNQYAQIAGADTAYINAKVLMPEEVAAKRAQEPGVFPKVDLEMREETLELRKERLMNPPEPQAFEPQGDTEGQPEEEPTDETEQEDEPAS